MTPESGYRDIDSLNGQHARELHALYQREWWTAGRSLENVERMLEQSDLVFGVCSHPDDRLVAFARVVTDTVFKALVLDLIVAHDHRQTGLGRRLMDRICTHPTLATVKHMELYCLPEMVGFYEKWGFSTDVSGVTFMRRSGSG